MRTFGCITALGMLCQRRNRASIVCYRYICMTFSLIKYVDWVIHAIPLKCISMILNPGIKVLAFFIYRCRNVIYSEPHAHRREQYAVGTYHENARRCTL